MGKDYFLLRLRYLWAFYKSTLWVTLPFAILVGCIMYSGNWLEDAIKVSLYFYSVWGLLLDAVSKICFRRSRFFFYYNAGWTIPALYAASFGISATTCLSIHFLLKWLWVWY